MCKIRQFVFWGKLIGESFGKLYYKKKEKNTHLLYEIHSTLIKMIEIICKIKYM